MVLMIVGFCVIFPLILGLLIRGSWNEHYADRASSAIQLFITSI